jgi:acyl dehydratase
MSTNPAAAFLNKWTETKVSYTQRDLLTYAVGIGCQELRHIWELDDDFEAFPTYPLVLGFKGTSHDVVQFPSEAMLSGPDNPPVSGVKVVLDGERYVEKIQPIPEDGAELLLKQRHIGLHKRGSGASLETEALITSLDGQTVYYRLVSGGFMVGAKGFEDCGTSNSEKVETPSRAPDSTVEFTVTPAQAQIYRLSGDYNPLHIDPDFAQMSGFKAPILHGLCSFGISVNAVLGKYADSDATKFKAAKGRFASPVMPGDTLAIDMWTEGNKIIFTTKVVSTGKVSINNAYIMLDTTASL